MENTHVGENFFNSGRFKITTVFPFILLFYLFYLYITNEENSSFL